MKKWYAKKHQRPYVSIEYQRDAFSGLLKSQQLFPIGMASFFLLFSWFLADARSRRLDRASASEKKVQKDRKAKKFREKTSR